MQPVIILHYNEIALKGGNRDWFERQLIGNIRWALRDVAGVRVQRMSGRIAIRFTDDTRMQTPARHRFATGDVGGDIVRITDGLSRVFGIANIQLGHEVRQERAALMEDAVAAVQRHLSVRHSEESSDEESHTQVPPSQNVRSLASLEMTRKNSSDAPGTFAVRVKRGNKSYPATSQELEREIGAVIAEATGLGVDLEHPDLTVAVEIIEDTAFVLLERVEGPGGLPVGISGRTLTLLSSGFDSPVAAWRMMKRGCVTDFI
ncbi:MAG: THUMP domain-containing protein, partial [bacterium]|nr:THUMP domain-containing protein [bacterium]